ncbi:phasin family protein [Methylocystis sp. Sn-Cys]|uniref:phasin family protein n=1 Tax=Methylocystis sp. Sn-Cys TaxID=1701263 RepID=UPI0019211E5E|nr:phasin family protein [Methylocystis sp. Sn-Cys]MBL1255877.1 phasin family protein [Methylocystis sp. Sn-Cys]
MAKQGKVDQHSGAPGAGQETPVDAPAQAPLEVHADEAAAPAPLNEGAASAVVAPPLAVIEEAVETAQESFSASFEFDTALWSKRSLELWSENAAAFLGLAEGIAKAKNFEEVVDLQSRFASERFEAFIRQSKELMEFARSLAALSAAPLCAPSKKAA